MVKKKIMVFLLAVFLVHCTAVPVLAAQPMPNLSENGSITFEMVKNNVPLNGGSINLCKVGNIQENDSNYTFVLVEELKGNNVDLKNPSDYDVAEELLRLVKKHNLTIQNAPIANGKASFTNLPVGLYLVWQDEKNATEGFSPIHPFLISIPKFDGTRYIQDIVAKPKVPLEVKPTETPSPSPTPTPPPKLPQTGQLNWPIPVMAGAGCVLFFIGLILYSGRKSTDNGEK